MKRYFYKSVLLCFLLASCTFANRNNDELMIATESAVAVIVTQNASPSLVASTSTSYPIILPSITMRPQESESALLELLKTNGNCAGKCIGGVRPDEMTMQDGVEIFSQWGTMSTYENPNGELYVTLDQNPLLGLINVYFSIGNRTKDFESIDHVRIRIEASSNRYIDESVWSENSETFQGFRMDKLLEAYGLPSYVGYDFSTLSSPMLPPEKGERISYGMSLHFDQLNLHILISAKAYFDGKSLLLCPSRDPHYLLVEINPERPLKELRSVFPVTWQALTDTDLSEYYQTFMVEDAFDVCVATNMEKIIKLQP